MKNAIFFGVLGLGLVSVAVSPASANVKKTQQPLKLPQLNALVAQAASSKNVSCQFEQLPLKEGKAQHAAAIKSAMAELKTEHLSPKELQEVQKEFPAMLKKMLAEAFSGPAWPFGEQFIKAPWKIIQEQSKEHGFSGYKQVNTRNGGGFLYLHGTRAHKDSSNYHVAVIAFLDSWKDADVKLKERIYHGVCRIS